MAERRKAPKGCYWRGKTLWGRFEIKGVEYRRSLRTGEAKLAASRLTAERDKIIAAEHFGENRPSWKDAFVAWSTAIGGHTKTSTSKRYLTSLTQIEPYLMDLYVDEINKTVIADIIRRRRAQGVTNATIRRDLTALSSVMSHCEEEGWREDNPALARLRKLKERRDPIVLPEPVHIEAVIARAPGNFAHLIRAAWLTGCRLDELRHLGHRQIDFKRGQVTLERTKTGRVRVFAMREAEAVFARTQKATTTDAVFWHGSDTAEHPASPYLNVSSNFRRLVASAQKSAQKEARKTGRECAFRPFRFHDLRHRFAVDFLKRGGGIYDLSKHLGHSSVKTTEIYLDFLTAEEAERAKRGSAQNPDQRAAVS